MTDVTVTWASGDESVATVDATGLVRSVGKGEAVVTATAGSATGSAKITIANPWERDLAALVAFYNATGGPNWRSDANWLTSRPPGDWHGVRVDSAGRVVELLLPENNLTGSIPPEIGDLSALTNLALRRNNLRGLIPPEIGDLVALDRLALHGNSFSGTLPPELGKLSKLRLLLVSANSLSGPIPPELGNLSRLERLHLDINRFNGPIPPELGNLSKLKGLTADANQLTGPIPPELGKLSNLEYLNLHINSLTDSIPSELGNLSKLQRFILHNNELSGSIPPELGGLTSVVDFRLDSNRLSGPLPPELGKLVNVKQFMVLGNELTGPIPPEFGNLASVERLYLWDNRLSGRIPPELGKLHRVEHLVFARNKLSGPIPPELGDLPRLLSIQFQDNNLAGKIPGALGEAPLLRSMNLGRNALFGSLPPKLFDSPHLGGLYLSGNRLSGPIPAEIGNLASLGDLDLRDNIDMAGPLPPTMTALDSVRILFATNTGLCAPSTPEFQRWLRSVPSERVPACAPGQVYLTQAVQHLDYPVPLVANQPALLRVFVTARKQSNATIPDVRARFYRGNTEIHTVTIAGKATVIPTTIDESSLAMSANVEVPGSVVRRGLEMVIEIDPDGTLDPELGVTTRIPETGRAGVAVLEVPDLDLTVLPMLWTEDPDSLVLDMTANLTEDDTLFVNTHRLLPVNDMGVQVHPPVESTSNHLVDLLELVSAIRLMEGGTGHYMGMITGELQGGAGMAHLKSRVSVSFPNSESIAHELGHNMSVLHAPCGNPQSVDQRYPHTYGSIGVWGYDFHSGTLVPPETFDLMGYCRPLWVSDFHFRFMISYRASQEQGTQAAVAAPVQSVLLWGGANASGVPHLQPLLVVDAPPQLPSVGGEYRLMGSDADGGELFALSFDMMETADTDGSSSFAFLLPVEPGWDDALASVTLVGPDGSATLDRESDMPMAVLRDPRTGQVRAFLRGERAEAAAAGAVPQRFGRGLEVLFTRGIPEAAAWQR